MNAHKNVFTALTAAQGEMGPLVKGAVNPHFKSRYATLDDVVNAVRPPLNGNGICFHFETLAGEMVAVLTHGESETSIRCGVPLLVSKNDIQAFKSATTYAKRIGLESVTGIAPADDDDGQAAAKSRQEPKQFAPAALASSLREDDAQVEMAVAAIAQMASLEMLANYWKGLARDVPHVAAAKAVITAKDARKLALTRTADLAGDVIPY
jgi:hypothetical protein